MIREECKPKSYNIHLMASYFLSKKRPSAATVKPPSSSSSAAATRGSRNDDDAFPPSSAIGGGGVAAVETDSSTRSSTDDDSDAGGREEGGSSRDERDVPSLDDDDSVASDATSASMDAPSSAGGGIDDSYYYDDASSWEEYDDGDLRTLNRLVNKLHAAEVRRDRRRRNGGNDVDGADDLPSALPSSDSPPRFVPFNDAPHRLSVSSVDSWRGQSFEVVPTDDVVDIMPGWRDEWLRDRSEWEERRTRMMIELEELRRSRVVPLLLPRNDDDRASYDLRRRNNSLPTNAASYFGIGRGGDGGGGIVNVRRSASASSSSSTANRNYKYGRPPSLPSANEPNPMVTKSSKRINKKHARYALCAGMMLGIRESVGGALGVEAELEISNWEGWERSWKGGCREEEEGEGEGEGGDEREDDDEKEEGGEDADAGEEGAKGKEVVLLVNGMESDGAVMGDDVSGPSLPSSSSPSRRRRSTNDPATLDVAATLTAECERIAKYKFPPNQFYLGSNTSSPLPHKYKFKVYAPLIFARIRSLFGVEKQTFLHSICGKFNFYEFASNARSGQFFFYSHDGRYMIKTLTFAESKFLREILPFYYRHLTRYPSTFLTHFYGMYRVCMPNANNQRLHFMIMRSVFHTKKKICRVWDLKGSTANRKSEPGDSVGKDLDILEEGRKLRFAEPGARDAFLEQLRRDATFLARLGIMDYSLLLGLHNREEESGGDNSPWGGAAPSTPPAYAVGEEPSRSNTPFRRGVLQRASTAGLAQRVNDGFKALEMDDGGEEPSRSNTPFRRGMLQRASTAGYTQRGSDGFEALETSAFASAAVVSDVHMTSSPSALNAIPELSRSSSGAVRRVPKSAITSRSDSGIEGYGVTMKNGTLAKTREIYFCGELVCVKLFYHRCTVL
jgi:hypothetical protein